MSRRTTAAAAAIFLALVATTVPGVAQPAEEPGAPEPSSNDRFLFAHHGEDGEDEYVGWMSTLSNETDATDHQMGDEYSCFLGFPPIEDPVDLTWDLDIRPVINSSQLQFVPDEPMRFVIYIGAEEGDGEELMINSTLRQGETVIAEAPAKAHNYTASGENGQYNRIEWAVTPNATSLRNGSLTWSIHVEGDPCTAEGVFLGVSPERGHSMLELPIAGGQSVPADFEDGGGNGTALEGSFNHSEPVNMSHEYNWTSGTHRALFNYSANVTNGSIAYAVDNGNSTVTQGFINSTGSDMRVVTTAGSNQWVVRFTLMDFEGSLDFTLRPSPGGPTNGTGNNTGGGGTGSGNGTGSDNETDNETGSGGRSPDEGLNTFDSDAGTDDNTTEEENSVEQSPQRRGVPGFGFFAVIAGALGAVFVASRRRNDRQNR